MANELPEVVQEVHSMPTTGWFIQTSGSARRRIAKNSGNSEAGVYDVAGVPGHTHNSSAVVSVDADYTRYRETPITVPALVWAHGALNLPVHLLTDSVEPEDAEERYDRAIEHCVGYMSLFPENCTGNIREPTRSIGEIRTLVAPKARLDTLTYVEERRGWRIPDPTAFAPAAAGAPNPGERAPLVSDFPAVYLDMRCLGQVIPATVDLDSVVGSCYFQSDNYAYRIVSAADGLGTIGTLANGSPWDGTLKFEWDSTRRRYSTRHETIVTLNHVVEHDIEDGAAQTPVYDLAAGVAQGAAHATRLTVEFPVLSTTEASDGFCWFGDLSNEEALNYASRTSGLDLCRGVPVSVLGIREHVGPFRWVSIPAYRVPVGSAYAHPAPGFLQENLQYNHWDKFDAFNPSTAIEATNGFLRHQYNKEVADVAEAVTAAALAGLPGPGQQGYHAATYTAALVAENRAAAKQSEHAFNLLRRTTTDKNGGTFYPRSAGILQQLTRNNYSPEMDLTVADVPQYLGPFPGGNNLPTAALLTSGMVEVMYERDAINAGLTAGAPELPIQYELDGTIDVDSAFAPHDHHSLSGAITFDFPAATFAAHQPPAAHVSDFYCMMPATPLMYQLTAKAGAGADQLNNFADFSGYPVHLSRAYEPAVIANCSTTVGTKLTVTYDFTDSLDTYEHNLGVPGGRIEAMIVANLAAQPPVQAPGMPFWLQGWSLWLHFFDQPKSNFYTGGVPNTNVPANDQTMRNDFKSGFSTGTKFEIAANKWYPIDFGITTREVYQAGNRCGIVLKDLVFALAKKETDFAGLYFETAQPQGAGQRKLMFYCPRRALRSTLMYTPGAGPLFLHAGSRLICNCGTAYTWSPATAARAAAVREATFAEVDAQSAQSLHMYVLGPDWYRTHVLDDPYAAIRADSNGFGAVYQSLKRISQHVCAPVLNPNLRIGAIAPLNHDTRHLPPELRDFRLRLEEIDWSRLQANDITLNELTLFEFKGGNQKQGSEQNIMYLPQFQEYKSVISGNTFDFNCYSSLGSPSYFCLFCRGASTDVLQQPRIKTLSVFNNTTQKKSNSIQDMSQGQLYHLTQRNVHAAAEYDRFAYNRRQTILLSAEDVGMMGLKSFEYQKAKRVNYRFTGTVDHPGILYVVLIYNNRGLHVDGRRLATVTLHE